MIYEKSCGAVVYFNFGNEIKYILVESTRRHWGFPKGHVVLGETEIETARREICEETGLKVNFIEGFKEEIRYILYEDIDKTVVYFLAEAENTNIAIDISEIEDFAWLNYKDSLEKISFKNVKNVLIKAHQFLLNNR